jgi:hypothetical protein
LVYFHNITYSVSILKLFEDLHSEKNSVFWDVFRVALVRTDVSEERVTSIITATTIGKVGTTLAMSRYVKEIVHFMFTAVGISYHRRIQFPCLNKWFGSHDRKTRVYPQCNIPD